jgi:hypothetical protein
MSINTLSELCDVTSAPSVIQFNIFNTIIKNLLMPIFDKLLKIDYKFKDFYIFDINIKPFIKEIIILIIIFYIFKLIKL